MRNRCASVLVLAVISWPHMRSESLRWLSLGTLEVKVEEANGSSVQVYIGGNIIAASSGTGDGIFGDLMMHLYGLSVWFVIFIWYVAAISHIDVQRAHRLRLVEGIRGYSPAPVLRMNMVVAMQLHVIRQSSCSWSNPNCGSADDTALKPPYYLDQIRKTQACALP